MNTNTITKVILAASGLAGLAFIGLTKIHADYLPLLGEVVSYGAALVILAIAAFDSNKAKRLT